MNDRDPTSDNGGWQVDRADDPGAFVKYLEASSESDLMRREVLQRLQKHDVQRARSVIDVGCGIGTHVRMLAAGMAPGARVVGVDASRTLLRTARQRTEGEARFVLGDAHHLPLTSHTFELAWVERALVHFASPSQALREIRRVLAPGGRALITEGDYEGLLLDCEDERAWCAIKERWLTHHKHPRIGRQLAKLLHGAEFVSVQLELELRRFDDLPLLLQTMGLTRHTASLVLDGTLEAGRAEAFWAEQRARAKDGCFFAAIPFVVAQASAPAR